jgi:hypothetical protein
LESTKPLATPVFLGFNQVVGLSQCSLESTKSPAIQVLLGFN